VIAIKDGFDGSRRRKGSEFDAPDGVQCSWFVPVTDQAKQALKAEIASGRSQEVAGAIAAAGPKRRGTEPKPGPGADLV